MSTPEQKKHRAEWSVFMWNRSTPGGSPITYEDDLGNLVDTETRSPAWVLPNGIPVVQVKGRSGSFILYRCRPRRVE